jgi:hypothetical protein
LKLVPTRRPEEPAHILRIAIGRVICVVILSARQRNCCKKFKFRVTPLEAIMLEQ